MKILNEVNPIMANKLTKILAKEVKKLGDLYKVLSIEASSKGL